MINLPWKVFEKTGNIEAYLLMKQMEAFYHKKSIDDNHDERTRTTFSNTRI